VWQPQVAIFTFFCGRLVFVANLLLIIFQQISPFFDLQQPRVGGNIELRRCWTMLSQVWEKVELLLTQVETSKNLTFLPGLVVTMWRAAARD